MVMVGVISHTGVFEWFAVEVYKKRVQFGLVTMFRHSCFICIFR